MELDRLAAEDVLDLLAGHRVKRLDSARVHHRQLADLVIGRTFAQRLDLALLTADGKPGLKGTGKDHTYPDKKPAESSHIESPGLAQLCLGSASQVYDDNFTAIVHNTGAKPASVRHNASQSLILDYRPEVLHRGSLRRVLAGGAFALLLAAVAEHAGPHVELREDAQHEDDASGVLDRAARVDSHMEDRLELPGALTSVGVLERRVVHLVERETAVRHRIVHRDRVGPILDALGRINEAHIARELGGLLGSRLEADLELVELEIEPERPAVHVIGDLEQSVAERNRLERGTIRRLAALDPDLPRDIPDGHLDQACGYGLFHLVLGQEDRLEDLLLDSGGQVVLNAEADGHGHVGPAAEGIDRLAGSDRARRADFGLAVLATAEDPVIERAIRPGQDLDLAESAVGLGIDHGRNHQVDRDEWRGGLG